MVKLEGGRRIGREEVTFGDSTAIGDVQDCRCGIATIVHVKVVWVVKKVDTQLFCLKSLYRRIRLGHIRRQQLPVNFSSHGTYLMQNPPHSPPSFPISHKRNSIPTTTINLKFKRIQAFPMPWILGSRDIYLAASSAMGMGCRSE